MIFLFLLLFRPVRFVVGWGILLILGYFGYGFAVWFAGQP